MDEVTKRTYRVKAGQQLGVRRLGSGEEVDLTEFEASGILDKVELVSSKQAEETTAWETSRGEEINISKSAVKWLAETGVELDLASVVGTGKDGQITVADVRGAALALDEESMGL